MARLRCRTSYGTRRTPTMSAGPPPAVADPGPPAAAYAGATPEPSWTDASLEDILTALALGHSARSSASPFAYVPPLASSPCRTSALRWVLLSRTDTLLSQVLAHRDCAHAHSARRRDGLLGRSRQTRPVNAAPVAATGRPGVPWRARAPQGRPPRHAWRAGRAATMPCTDQEAPVPPPAGAGSGAALTARDRSGKLRGLLGFRAAGPAWRWGRA